MPSLTGPAGGLPASRPPTSPPPSGPIPADQLLLHYQPLVSMASPTLYAVEVLARWNHPKLGLLMPRRFIARAAESGAIIPITALVLQKAAARQAAWRKQGLRLAVAVNVSALYLAVPDVASRILGFLAEHGCAPEDLIVEITEGEAVQNPAAAREQLQRLADAGVGIAMDDFGQGESTPERLAYFPFSNLKLDRSLVGGADQSRRGLTVLHKAVALAREHGVSVTGEGIETLAHWDRLAEIGCDYAQGYFVSPPLAEAELLDWIDETIRSGRFRLRGRD